MLTISAFPYELFFIWQKWWPGLEILFIYISLVYKLFARVLVPLKKQNKKIPFLHADKGSSYRLKTPYQITLRGISVTIIEMFIEVSHLDTASEGRENCRGTGLTGGPITPDE